MSRDRKFRDSVLQKYSIASAGPGAASPGKQPPQNTDVTDAMIKKAAARAAPFAIATLVIMVLLANLMMRNTAAASVVAAAPTPTGTPQLPEDLQLVRLAGMNYNLCVLSGRVLDKETSVKTTVVTTTKQGEVYAMAGEIHTTPAQVTTSTSTTQTDLLWVQTPGGRETSWNFVGGTFKARPGHVVSVIARPLRDGATSFLMAANHTTGQLETFDFASAHMTRRGFLTWFVISLLGAAGFAVAYGILLSIQPPEHSASVDKVIYPITLLIEGFVTAAILAAPMVLWIKKRIWKRRNRQFTQAYLPRLKTFLQQAARGNP